jgi:hypothetical protein
MVVAHQGVPSHDFPVAPGETPAPESDASDEPAEAAPPPQAAVANPRASFYRGLQQDFMAVVSAPAPAADSPKP